MSSWVEDLCSHLEDIREAVVRNALVESEKRMVHYDKGSIERSIKVGSRVLSRIPGMVSKLQAVCSG